MLFVNCLSIPTKQYGFVFQLGRTARAPEIKRLGCNKIKGRSIRASFIISRVFTIRFVARCRQSYTSTFNP